MKNQEASFKKLNVDYQRLEFEWEGRIIENKPNISIDKILLENSSDQVLVRNIATVKIAQDVNAGIDIKLPQDSKLRTGIV